MAGHSKWANIKHKKAATDKKRSADFQKYTKEIMVAVKEGGNNPDTNARLRLAIDKAKAGNMPNDNIDRILAKADQDKTSWQEIVYEGYGPNGVAVMVYCVTDNTNRTASSVKATFSKYGGNLGTSGSVSYMFHNKGIIVLDLEKVDMDTAMEIALEAGASDMKDENGVIIIETEPTDLISVKEAFESKGITEFLSAEATKVPDMKVALDDSAAEKLQTLVEALEDNDDVNDVYTNVE